MEAADREFLLKVVTQANDNHLNRRAADALVAEMLRLQVVAEVETRQAQMGAIAVLRDIGAAMVPSVRSALADTPPGDLQADVNTNPPPGSARVS